MRTRTRMYRTCIHVCMYGTCVYVYAFTLHACTCMHLHYIRVRVCMYGTCVYVYAFTLHACTCMHVRYMRVRVCMCGTCVYVYAFTLHACTCMHLQYIRVRVCMLTVSCQVELSHTFRIQNLILYNAHSTFDLQSNYRSEFLDKEQRSQGLVSASVLVSFRTIYTTTKSQDSLISIFRIADPNTRTRMQCKCIHVHTCTVHACTYTHVM